MSALTLAWPSDEEIIAFAKAHQLAPADVLRDIARMVAVHQMVVEKGYLSEDCVLCGGLALRFYGSPRFTITDTDVSYRPSAFRELDLEEALTLSGAVEDLEITPASPTYWQQRRDLVIAQPIRFTQGFSEIKAPEGLATFKVTVSRRGLFLPAVWSPIRHDYTPFGIEGVDVPLMAISEQLAEKIIGWAVSGLLKHYLDAAWIVHRALIKKEGLLDLDRDQVIHCLTEKLAVSKEREPDNYSAFTTWEDFRGPLVASLAHTAPVDTAPDRGSGLIRYIDRNMTTENAELINTKKLVPWLFDS